MNARPEKILALQFKYFGDAVLMTPALRALREKFPQGELHLLVPEEIAPIVPAPAVAQPRLADAAPARQRAAWAKPGRSSARCAASSFDRSVDFAGNDRGAIVSFLIGARQRLGWAERGGFLGRRFCYNRRVAPESKRSTSRRGWHHLLSAWDITPSSLEAEIHADPAWPRREKILPGTKPPLPRRLQPAEEGMAAAALGGLYRLAAGAGLRIASPPPGGEREQALMTELKKLAPDARCCRPMSELPLFLAVAEARGVFISGDTGPLHFAAGLGVPTIALFGPSSAAQWAPAGKRHRTLTGNLCGCDGNSPVCNGANHCLAAISPESVFAALREMLAVR